MEKRFFTTQQMTILKLVLDGVPADDIATLINEEKTIVQEQVATLVMALLNSNTPHAIPATMCASAR